MTASIRLATTSIKIPMPRAMTRNGGVPLLLLPSVSPMGLSRPGPVGSVGSVVLAGPEATDVVGSTVGGEILSVGSVGSVVLAGPEDTDVVGSTVGGEISVGGLGDSDGASVSVVGAVGTGILVPVFGSAGMELSLVVDFDVAGFAVSVGG